jgi:phage protein D
MTDPAFSSARPRLKVGDRERADLADALQAATLNLPLHGMAHGELLLNFFGADEDDPAPDFRFTDVALGDRVQVAFGETDALRVFDGEITGIEERYGNGAPRLVLLLQDPLHRLARTRPPRVHEATSVDDLLRGVADAAGLEHDVAISDTAADWHQLNESDLALLLRVLGPYGVALRMHNGVLRARAEEPDPDPIALDAADNALRARLLADLAHQPTRTRVLGWDLGAGEAVSGERERLEPAPAGDTAAALLGQLGWDGEELVPRPWPATAALAADYARGHFERRARAFCTGEVLCIGEPRLRAGREVQLSGVSPRMAGTWGVSHCVHGFDAGTGYRTRLRLSRGGWGSANA